MWTSYCKEGADKKDVAIQLPTGSGKTLIALMIAEWRRKKFQERVIFLCPTKQLANQVAAQAEESYGMKVALMLGGKDSYSPEAKSDYLGGEKIAISTYSNLFNINPFFDDPHTILMDDAHACEDYVASMWTMQITREDHEALYLAIVNLLRPMLEPHEYARLCGRLKRPEDQKWTEMVPSNLFRMYQSELIGIIDSHVENSKLRFPWALIHQHLHACHLYFGMNQITIRPFIAPTHTHAPFVGAKQRIYISATLGNGGELERISGRKGIVRLPVPATLEKQGVGRRLYFFPERSMKPGQIFDLQMDMLRMAKKGVFLVPNGKVENELTEGITDKVGCPVFNASEIEESKLPFVAAPTGAVVAANRYDGIDFPGDESHLLFVVDMPRAMNLQERFIMNRFCAVALYNERRQTRIIQAFGRCTRSSNDYAAVVVQGDELYEYLMKPENRKPLHPELQAELAFGIQQAGALSPQEALDNLNIFLYDRDKWADIDGHILDLRDQMVQEPFEGIDELRLSVQDELEYLQEIWNGNHSGARDAADEVLKRLKSPKLRGYRAWWHYLAGTACATMASNGSSNMDVIARRYFLEAYKAAPTVPWLLELAHVSGTQTAQEFEDMEALKIVERIENRFVELGSSDIYGFSQEEKNILEGVVGKKAKQFEDAQRRLGLLLGYDADKSPQEAAPDPWWIANRKLCFVFEDHSFATTDMLDTTKARQTASHVTWIREEQLVDEDASIIAVLVSGVTKTDPGAVNHLKGFRVWPIEQYRDWATKALSVIRTIRRSFPGPGDLVWRDEAKEALKTANLLHSKLAEHFHPGSAKEFFCAEEGDIDF